MRQNKRKFLT